MERARQGQAAESRNEAADGLRFVSAISIASSLGSALFLSLIPKAHAYYFQILLLCLSPLAAVGLAGLGRRAVLAVRTRSATPAVEAIGLLAIVLLGLLPHWLGGDEDPPAPARYEWRPSGSAAIDAVVRPIFWSDEKRVPGWYPAWTHYLWRAGFTFRGAEGLAREVRDRSEPDETIFGDPNSTPLIALLADRRITLDEADTNGARFQREGTPVEDMIERLETEPPRLLLVQRGQHLMAFPAFVEWVQQNYTLVLKRDEPFQAMVFYLLERNGEEGREARD